MSSQPFPDHFSSTAAGYAAYRPSYPPALIEWLASLCAGHELALDCGCGTGQLAVPLAEHFAQVVATDASAEQIRHAVPHPRVTYEVRRAESSGLLEASVDLITVAQAAHWFKLSAFYSEVLHVAYPDAVIALITYGTLHVPDDAGVDAIIQEFYRDTLDPYWPPERRHVESGYRTLPFPFDEVDMPAFDMVTHWTVSEVIGYIRTWSAVSAARKARGDTFSDGFESQLREAWGSNDLRRTIRWPLAGRVGRVL
ncbi:MAG: methyltransferase domain-containing protein [Gemmatimonadaceae bacterium]|nr:methyltransferase domain-containing protein [Gemmatimonadaceae bacterium]